MTGFWNLPPEADAVIYVLIWLVLALAVWVVLRHTFKPRATHTSPAVMMLNKNDAITLHQCYEGVLATGSSGSGKTSTLLRLMLSLMRQKTGMLFLTAKIDDYDTIAKIAKEAGRAGDVRRFAPGEPWKMDFLQHELSSPGASVSTAGVLMQDLVDANTRTDSAKSNDPFFPLASGRQIRMAITIIYAAKGSASVADVFDFVTSMPMTAEETLTPAFLQGSCGQYLMAAANNRPNDDDVVRAASYVLKEWPRTGDRTMGSIAAQTMNVLEKFMSGSVRELVASGETNLSPQDVLNGRIVVADVPTLKFRESGQFVQMVWKILTQRAVLRRQLTKDSRNVVIWADEAQLHALPSVDSMTQAVARSHKLIQVAITQNIPLLVSVLKNREDALAWIANMNTRFIFNNGDRETCDYFSTLLGQSKQMMSSGNMPVGPVDLVSDAMGFAPQQSGSAGYSSQMLPNVPGITSRCFARAERNSAIKWIFTSGKGAEPGATAGRSCSAASSSGCDFPAAFPDKQRTKIVHRSSNNSPTPKNSDWKRTCKTKNKTGSSGTRCRKRGMAST